MVKNTKLLGHFNGGFKDCAISADWFELPDGLKFWEFTIVSAVNYRPVDQRINAHFLIWDNNIQCFEAGVAFPGLNSVIGNRVDVDAADLQDALAVIRKWELAA